MRTFKCNALLYAMVALGATACAGNVTSDGAHTWDLSASGFEAETLSSSSSTDRKFSDSTASGGAGFIYYINGTGTHSMTATLPLESVSVRAKADLCGGSPHLVVRVDGVV